MSLSAVALCRKNVDKTSLVQVFLSHPNIEMNSGTVVFGTSHALVLLFWHIDASTMYSLVRLSPAFAKSVYKKKLILSFA